MTRSPRPLRTAPRRRLGRRTGPRTRRALVVLLVQLLAMTGVAVRLVDVQVLRADEYAARGAAQRARTVALPAQRGRIYDREGEVLATSVDSATIYADPRAFRPRTAADGSVIPPAADPAAVAAELAPLLGRDAAWLEQQLRRDAHFVYLARQLDRSTGEQVLALELPGIGVLTEPERVYPAGGLAGQVVGFTDIDGRGLSGLELRYDGLLSGEPGTLAWEVAPGGLAIASAPRQLVPPTPGTDLVLTIDREIQHVAERAAAEAVAAYDAVAASVVVLEVGTGEVLAMASAPGMDPNDPAATDPANWRNRSVTDVFEPGSVQKAVTAAAALEAGVVTPDTVLEVPDRIVVGGRTFSDAHPHPTTPMTFAEVIAASSNVGTIMVAQRLGAERLAAALSRFGYGRPLGIDFPGEAAGMLLPVEQWWATSLPTIAIGQGVAVTLLQAANVYATIANGGVAVGPRLVRGTVGADGRLRPAPAPPTHEVIAPEVAAQVTDMLTAVVSGERGTGRRAAVPGYTVAGKTGTARKPRTDGPGYSDRYVATFVGFAPAEDPRLVVAVMVDEPTPIWGGVVAAPVFAEVMRFALIHRGIPPSDGGPPLPELLARARVEAAELAAQQEGPATPADVITSPPGGDPATPDG